MAAEAAVRCRGARESVADQLHRSGLWDRGRSPPLLTPTNLCSVGMYLVWQVALSRGATAWCLFAAPSPRRVSHPNQGLRMNVNLVLRRSLLTLKLWKC